MIRRTVPLAEVCEINPRLSREPREDETVSFLGMSDVSEDGTTTRGIDRLYNEVRKAFTPFDNGDVLVAKITPCFQNGKIVQASLAHTQGFGSTEFHVVRPRSECLNDRYLLHFLRTSPVRIDGERRMTGTGGQRRVPVAYLRELEIPLPPIAEQCRIAAILDHADGVRAKRREALARLGEVGRLIFIDMFGDPVVNGAGWPETTLDQLGDLDRGVSRHRPRNDPTLLGGPYPLVQTGEVSNSGGYITSTSLSYSAVGLAQSKMWPAGTLCITIVGANIAKTGILTFDACFPDSVVGFTPKEPFDAEYVRIWLRFLERALVARAPESARKNLNLAILRALPIPVPPLRKRQMFSERIDKLNQLIIYQKSSLEKLDMLFASIQSRAFLGKA